MSDEVERLRRAFALLQLLQNHIRDRRNFCRYLLVSFETAKEEINYVDELSDRIERLDPIFTDLTSIMCRGAHYINSKESDIRKIVYHTSRELLFIDAVLRVHNGPRRKFHYHHAQNQ